MAAFAIRFLGLVALFTLFDIALVLAATGGAAPALGALLPASVGRGLGNAIIGSVLALVPGGLERWRRGAWPSPNWFGIVALVTGALIMAATYIPAIAG